VSRRFVWDASPLVHAHKIERLDVLGELAAGPAEAGWQNFTTAAVVEELASHGGSSPDGLKVHGSLWLIAQAVSDCRWSMASATSFADQLKVSGARYPFEVGGFEAWARKARLI
jgi:hypothetical protein